jgi:hypothetical protein
MPGGATAQSHADADGRFVLTGVAASHAGVITAKASGFSSSSKYLDLPLQSELVIGLEQQFEFRVRLKGIGGSPIPGGVVCIGGGSAVSYDLIRGEAHSAFRTLAAEPDGAHLLVGMPQGRYWCFAAATGHAPRAELVLVSRQTAPHEITLESASGRSGTVRDAETLAPVSGARVQVLPKWSDWDLPGITAVKDALAGGCASITDDSGTFWAPCLDETVGVLHCDADGYSPERLQVLEIATSGSIDLRLRPLHRKDVPVLIQSIAGHPISDAVVIASGGVRSADSGGRCVLPAVSTIEPIQVLAPGYISRAVFPSHDATSYPQLIVLARAGPPVCGQVVDRAGAPLPGVVVQCEGIDGEQVLPIGYYDRYQVTDEKGMVAFVQPIAPQYRVFVAPTRGSGEVRTTASESFVLIADVIEHSRIRGSVVLLGGRSIPPGLRVSATRDDPGARRVTQDADVRRDGSFEIADLAPGTWAVRASGVTARNRIQPVSEVKRVVTSRGDVEVRLELREELLLGLVRDE